MPERRQQAQEQAYRDDAGEEAAGVRAKPAQRHGKLTETMAKRRQQAQERDQRRVRARLHTEKTMPKRRQQARKRDQRRGRASLHRRSDEEAAEATTQL